MGLDACVFCDCYEMGKVNVPPPQPELVFVNPETGQVLLHCGEPGADERLFDEWLASACEHGPIGQLVAHYLGNTARISLLRTLFESTPERFPTLLAKVVYSGIHAGDALSLADVEQVAQEISTIRTLYCDKDSQEAILRKFERQMTELVRAARKVRKPIVF